MTKEQYVTIRKLVLRIIALFILTIFLIEFFVGQVLKHEAITRLAKGDALHTSEMVFEAMYTKMQDGWGRQDIKKILKRLNGVRKGIQINIYRSPIVEALYGTIAEDRAAIARDKDVAQAMQGQDVIKLLSGDRVRFLYPIKVKKQCLSCHYNAKVGDINGVIDITMPVSQIVVSLDQMLLYFAVVLTIFLLLFFFFFYRVFDRKLFMPLASLADQIAQTKEHIQTWQPIRVATDCFEVKMLEKNYNDLMRTIRYFYDRLIRNASHDALTGLANLSRLQMDIQERTVGLAIFNIDRFKEINDYYGFEVGDRVIYALAKELQALLEQGKLYRMGGSEFAWVLDRPIEEATIASVIELLHRHLRESQQLVKFRIHVTVGLVAWSDDRPIEKASLALNEAKRRHRAYEFFSRVQDVQERYRQRIFWMQEVEDALQEDRVLLHYQPIFSNKEGRVAKYEALVRIIDREGKVHMPGEFMGVLEHSSLYKELTKRVIQLAFARFANVSASVSINLGNQDLIDEHLIAWILRKLQTFSDPKRITFEILESEEICDFEMLHRFVDQVHQVGAEVAVDDFGSGYSNFHYLLRIRADYFKIDASLIRHIHTDENSRLLVENIVHFAKKIGIQTVAEFVENEEIASVCRSIGIDFLQGYYIGRPSPTIEA